MKVWLLMISTIMLLPIKASSLVNPFACKRQPQEVVTRVKGSLGVVELVGIIGSDENWQAVLQYSDHIHTLRAGERIGDVVVREVSAISVCVLYKNKELVLTVKDE